MGQQHSDQVTDRACLDTRGVGSALAALTAGMAVVVVAGVSGIIAGAWLLSW